MGQQRIEIEVLDASREKPGVQHRQYRSRWPYPVAYADDEMCEFQYQAFAGAYRRITNYEGDLHDAELRARWVGFFNGRKTPTSEQYEAFARRALHGDAYFSPRELPQRLAVVAVLVLVVLVVLFR